MRCLRRVSAVRLDARARSPDDDFLQRAARRLRRAFDPGHAALRAAGARARPRRSRIRTRSSAACRPLDRFSVMSLSLFPKTSARSARSMSPAGATSLRAFGRDNRVNFIDAPLQLVVDDDVVVFVDRGDFVAGRLPAAGRSPSPGPCCAPAADAPAPRTTAAGRRSRRFRQPLADLPRALHVDDEHQVDARRQRGFGVRPARAVQVAEDVGPLEELAPRGPSPRTPGG